MVAISDSGASAIFFPPSLLYLLTDVVEYSIPLSLPNKHRVYSTHKGSLGLLTVIVADIRALVGENYLTSDFPFAFIREKGMLQLVDLSRLHISPSSALLICVPRLDDGLHSFSLDDLIKLKEWRPHPSYIPGTTAPTLLLPFQAAYAAASSSPSSHSSLSVSALPLPSISLSLFPPLSPPLSFTLPRWGAHP